LLDNYNSSIWTVFERRFRQVPNPIVNFHEECTITVFSDRENPFTRKRNWDLNKNSFIIEFLYALLSRGKFSIFLILRFFCERPVPGDLVRYPVSIFIHYLNCVSPEFKTEGFPGFVLDQRRNAYKRRERSYSMYSQKEVTDNKGICINFLMEESRKDFMDCTTFHKLALTSSKMACSQVLYLAQHLSLKLNFTLYYYYNMENAHHSDYWSFNGIIDSTTSRLDETIHDTTYSVALYSYCLWVIYCMEIPRRSETFTFTAWWAPFQAEVWTTISATLVLSALTLVTLRKGYLV